MAGFTTNRGRSNRSGKRDSIIIGIRPLMEAIDNGKQIDNVLIQRGNKGELFKELLEKIKEHRIGYKLVPEEKLNRVSRKNHQGVIAFISPIEFQDLDEVITRLFESGKNPKLVILDRVSDVGNFGAICRSAECFGYDAIVVPFKGAAQISEVAVKTSAGAILNLQVCKVNDLAYTADFLNNSGIETIAVTEKTDRPLTEINIDGPHCLVLGSEEDGINEDLLKVCSRRGSIPMAGKTESLNVSVSAGIAMYELQKNVHI